MSTPRIDATDPDERAEALLARVRADPSEADVACTMLADPHPLVRIAAAVALLESRGDARGRGEIVAGLEHADEDVRAAAAMAWPSFEADGNE